MATALGRETRGAAREGARHTASDPLDGHEVPSQTGSTSVAVFARVLEGLQDRGPSGPRALHPHH